MWLTLAQVAVASPSWRVDLSPLRATDGVWPLSRSLSCADPSFRPLGVALVVYGRKSGASAYGHASIRTVWCEGGALNDTAWEVYRLGRWNEEMLRLDHAGEPWLEEEDGWLASQRGAAILFQDRHPHDGGWFREAMRHNREVYELWLDLPQQRAGEVIRELQGWWAQQQAALEAGGELRPSYVLWSRNCTLVWKRTVPELDPGSALPFAWLRALEEEALLRVMHPSAAVARRMAGADGAWPTEARRPHPVLRGGRVWPEELPEADPVGPWTLLP